MGKTFRVDKLKVISISFRGTGKRQREKGAGNGSFDVLVKVLGELDYSE